MAKITTLKQLKNLIDQYKGELIAEAKETGGVRENFGQDRVRAVRNIVNQLTDFDSPISFEEREAARLACEGFNEWASTYSLF